VAERIFLPRIPLELAAIERILKLKLGVVTGCICVKVAQKGVGCTDSPNYLFLVSHLVFLSSPICTSQTPNTTPQYYQLRPNREKSHLMPNDATTVANFNIPKTPDGMDGVLLFFVLLLSSLSISSITLRWPAWLTFILLNSAFVGFNCIPPVHRPRIAKHVTILAFLLAVSVTQAQSPQNLSSNSGNHRVSMPTVPSQIACAIFVFASSKRNWICPGAAPPQRSLQHRREQELVDELSVS